MFGGHILGIPVEENAPLIIPAFSALWFGLGCLYVKLRYRNTCKCKGGCKCEH